MLYLVRMKSSSSQLNSNHLNDRFVAVIIGYLYSWSITHSPFTLTLASCPDYASPGIVVSPPRTKVAASRVPPSSFLHPPSSCSSEHRFGRGWLSTCSGSGAG